MTRLIGLGAAAFTLAACEPGSQPFGGSSAGSETTTPRAQTSTRLVERDVEAPQVFQANDTALWDGRPSLGGVWVASPQAKDPERVIMRNASNGKFVIGALFRREQENPGPSLQISSDAAEALGVLAGQPIKLSVTALRRENASGATTAPQTPILDSQEPLASTTAAQMAANPPAPPPSQTLAQTPTPAPVQATLAATLPGGTAKPAAAQSPQPKKTAAKDAAPVAKGQGRSIQIGFFSQEANASRARDQLAKAGISAQIRKDSAQGKDYWSVFSKGDAAALKKIQSAGFADAYLLK